VTTVLSVRSSTADRWTGAAAHARFDSVGSFNRVFVLPDADDLPPCIPQSSICVSVTDDVRLELGDPPRPVGFGDGRVNGTAVPIATVDVHRDL
jgi:hypothetical protein